MPRKGIHPTFKKKRVIELECRFCYNVVCDRGMKAILLADTNIELYSTDMPPKNSVDLINDAYCTEKCKCKIRDVACLGCGNSVGYTVVLPCRACLEDCNNGHFWMFHSNGVIAQDKADNTGMEILRWGSLLEEMEQHKTSSTDAESVNKEDECCR